MVGRGRTAIIESNPISEKSLKKFWGRCGIHTNCNHISGDQELKLHQAPFFASLEFPFSAVYAGGFSGIATVFTLEVVERTLARLLALLLLLLLLMLPRFPIPPPGGILLNLLKLDLNVSLVAAPVKPSPRGFSSRGDSRRISSKAEKEGRAATEGLGRPREIGEVDGPAVVGVLGETGLVSASGEGCSRAGGA